VGRRHLLVGIQLGLGVDARTTHECGICHLSMVVGSLVVLDLESFLDFCTRCGSLSLVGFHADLCGIALNRMTVRGYWLVVNDSLEMGLGRIVRDAALAR
jgi:hypothetical protein